MRKLKIDSKKIRKQQKRQQIISKQQQKTDNNKEKWDSFLKSNPIDNFLSLKSVNSLEVLESQKKIVFNVIGKHVVCDRIDFYPCSNKLFIIPFKGHNIWVDNGIEWIKNNIV